MNLPRVKDELQIFILAGMIVMGIFSELDRLSPLVGILLLILLVAIEVVIKPGHLKTNINGRKPKHQNEMSTTALPSLTLEGLLTGLIIMLPSLIMMISQWQAEFPFSGDHDHHVFAAVAARDFWRSYFWLPLGLAAGAVYILKNKPIKFWGAGAFVALWLLSLVVKGPEYYFSRYPAFGYLLTSPLIAIADAFDWKNLIVANQVTQFLALPAWLFALRPYLIKRWPDVSLLLFALLIYWQKDFVYYQTSAYLEPWSLVFLALAIESALSANAPRWQPVLLMGVATWFKETSILFLPFIWIGSYGPFVLKKKTAEIKEAIVVGAASVAPFLAYYAMRTQDKIFRTSESAEYAKVFTDARLQEFLFRIKEQWQVGGLVLLFLVLCTWVWWLFKNKTQGRWAICLLLAAIPPIPFYFMDAIAINYPGYPRFYLSVFVLLASPLLFVAKMDWVQRRQLLAVAAVVAILQSVTLFPFLLGFAASSENRSFFEHYDSPVYFPLRATVEKAVASGKLRSGERIAVLSPIPNLYPQSLMVGYRDLTRTFKFAVATMPNHPAACTCQGEFKALFIPIIAHVGLGHRSAQADQVRAQSTACVEQLRTSCQNIYEQILPDGQRTGILGVSNL